METRKEELLKIQSHINDIDADITKILQHLQWDRHHLLEKSPKVICKYDANHRFSQECKEKHEAECRLAYNGYTKEGKMLPDPYDTKAKTLIQLNKVAIKQIITQAANADPSFKKENVEIEPQTLDRLQSTYTGDERRAIYDAVVQAAPFCHDLSDLTLLSEQGHEGTQSKQKSRLEILAELRDMKRRRTKYRVAAKTRNYSDVLRDVIKTQMEMYTDVKLKKSETSTSNDKWKNDIQPATSKLLRPARNESSLTTECNNYKHKREHSRSMYDEYRPTGCKMARHSSEIDSSPEHKNYRDRKHSNDKRGKERRLDRDRTKYEDSYNSEKRKDGTDKHRKCKRYDEERSSEVRKKYDSSNQSTHRREKHSYREYDEHYKSNTYYSSREHVSRKDKRKYEYRK